MVLGPDSRSRVLNAGDTPKKVFLWVEKAVEQKVEKLFTQAISAGSVGEIVLAVDQTLRGM